MNIANVTKRFMLISGADSQEAYRWRDLIDDACKYVASITIKDDINSADVSRLEMLCAVYAFRLYTLCNDNEITSFSVGDVRVASPRNAKLRGEELWEKYKHISSDLIDTDSFLFGRVM